MRRRLRGSPPARHVDREVDGDRLAPVALAREHPVAQLVVDLAARRALAARAARRSRACISGVGRPSNSPLLHGDAVVDEGRVERRRAACRPGSPPRRSAARSVLANAKSRSSCAGHGHDRAGAVAAEHVVGDPDRDRRAVERVDGERAGGDAGLLLGQRRALACRSCARRPATYASTSARCSAVVICERRAGARARAPCRWRRTACRGAW